LIAIFLYYDDEYDDDDDYVDDNDTDDKQLVLILSLSHSSLILNAAYSGCVLPFGQIQEDGFRVKRLITFEKERERQNRVKSGM
jgi:hypothetical protein